MFCFNHHDDQSKSYKCGTINGWLGCALLLALTFFVGFKTRNTLREYKFIGNSQNSITVSGTGKVIIIPDIAVISLGSTNEQTTVVAAADATDKIMNGVIAKLKSLGIDSKDIQTDNYSIYPAYDYAGNKQTLRGYVVSQNLTVKVRKLEVVSTVLSAATALGVNQVGGLVFTVDDLVEYKQQARIKAIANAKQKATALSGAAGIKLGRVLSFSESADNYPGPVPYGAGGGGAEIKSAPSIEAGSNEITVNANLTYEVE